MKTHLSDLTPETNGERFVWSVGDYRTSFPDMPDRLGDFGGIVLWDRQEGVPVATVHGAYAQTICLETTGQDDAPFTLFADWLNRAGNVALASEGIPATKPC